MNIDDDGATPDTGVAIAFLKRFHPRGPWVLSCDGPGFPTQTFTIGQLDEMRQWIDERQGKRNIYFSLGRPRRRLSKKLTKADIAQLSWAWVDIDARSPADRPRILAELRSAELPPSVIIDSGGGYWGFWRRAEPIKIEAVSEAAFAEAERVNVVLAAQFGGADHCHNLDRVARLPGTINLPNEKKRSRGQTTRAARIVEGDWERRYSAAELDGMTVKSADASSRERTPPKKDGPDHTNSGLGLKLAGQIVRRGGNEDEFRVAVADDPEIGGSTWAANERQVHRAWVKAVSDFRGEKNNRPPLVHFHADTIYARLKNNYLIKGVLNAMSLAVMYGDSSVGKTFLVLYLAYCIAAESEFFGRKTRKVGVVYVAAEAGESIDNRVVAVRDKLDWPLKEIPVEVIRSPINLYSDTADVERLVELIETVRLSAPVGLIIIDTLASVTPGANENSSEDMGAAIGNLNRLRHRTGAAILVVHHSGKDQSKGARGWSGLRAAVDTEIEITRDGDIRYADLGSKQRDSKDGSRVSFSLREVALGKDEDGDDVTSCVIQELNSDLTAEAIREKPLSKAKQAVIDIIEELRAKGEVTIKQLRLECVQSHRVSAAETLKDRRDAFRRVFRDLASEKLVFVKGNIVLTQDDYDF